MAKLISCQFQSCFHLTFYVYPYHSKTCILQVHCHYVHLECTVTVCFCAYWTRDWFWLLVIMYTLFHLNLSVTVWSLFSKCFIFPFAKFFLCRLYSTTIVCYHAFYLPLLYVTFLADFFQVIITLVQFPYFPIFCLYYLCSSVFNMML